MSGTSGLQGPVARVLTYDASGTITAANVAQLVLPERLSTSMLLIQNISSTANILVELGSARATATISGGKVTSIAVTNAGFNFTVPPTIEFLGGGRPGNTALITPTNTPGFDAPQHPAKATAVMSSATPAAGNKVASINIDDPGSGYYSAPFVWIKNSRLDYSGSAAPSATSGILLIPAGSYCVNDNTNPTDAVSVFSATINAPFTVKWRP